MNCNWEIVFSRSSLVCGGKMMIHFQEQQHTYCSHFFWAKNHCYFCRQSHIPVLGAGAEIPAAGETPRDGISGGR